VILAHNVRTMPREASAAQAASFKRGYRNVAFRGPKATFRYQNLSGSEDGSCREPGLPQRNEVQQQSQ
jgi:hypothetical protein